MYEGFDEAELLALIEDGLAPRDAESLRERLAAHPRLAEAVERMRQDRAVLRTDAEPMLPLDLMAELEPMIARPMLMPDASELRRRRRRRPWRLYAAAVVVLASVAGLWAAAAMLLRLAGPAVEVAEAPASPPAFDAEPAVETRAPSGPVVQVHAPPTVAGSPPAEAPSPGAPQRLAAGFALVFATGDRAEVERALEAALRQTPRAALVRNFSSEEYRRLEHELRLAQGINDRLTRADAAGAVAGESIGRSGRPARRGAGSAPARRAAGDDQATSGQLVGPADLAPDFALQLEFSDHGADYTMALPAPRVAEVLQRLALAGYATTLRTLDDADAAAGRETLDWLREIEAISEAAAMLSTLPPETIIFVPVVVGKT